jgi:hemerythrin superfamily protein
MNALVLLKQDHGNVQALFERFEHLGDDAAEVAEKRRVADKIIEHLSVHAAIEEQVFYPAVRKLDDLEDDILEAIEENHIVKWTLSELEGLSPEEENFDAKVTVLIENVRHHVKEEEKSVFPQVRKAMGQARLNDLGQSLADAKISAPTRPDPHVQSEPVAGAA